MRWAFAFLLAGMFMQAAQAGEPVPDLLRRGGFDSAITQGTTFQEIYRKNGNVLLFYTNRPPTTGHENRRIIVLKNGRYAYDYDAGNAWNCQAVRSSLICNFDMTHSLPSSVKLEDIFAGRKILIGGDLAVAYRGEMPLHERDRK